MAPLKKIPSKDFSATTSAPSIGQRGMSKPKPMPKAMPKHASSSRSRKPFRKDRLSSQTTITRPAVESAKQLVDTALNATQTMVVKQAAVVNGHTQRLKRLGGDVRSLRNQHADKEARLNTINQQQQMLFKVLERRSLNTTATEH